MLRRPPTTKGWEAGAAEFSCSMGWGWRDCSKGCSQHSLYLLYCEIASHQQVCSTAVELCAGHTVSCSSVRSSRILLPSFHSLPMSDTLLPPPPYHPFCCSGMWGSQPSSRLRLS
jgi:hypothetical protein